MADNDLPNRKSIRLKEYDYAQAGAYFVTICSLNKQCVFGMVEEDTVQLSELGRVVEDCWRQIADHFANAELDEFIIMPNHIHGIIILSEQTPNCRGVACNAREPETSRGIACNALESETSRGVACSARDEEPDKTIMRPGTLSTITRSFKSAASKIARERDLIADQILWQRNFFERIIRNDDALCKAREYVLNNPLRWALDKENPDHT